MRSCRPRPPSGLTTPAAARVAADVARGLLPSTSMQVLFNAIDGMNDALTYHRERHTILAGNLANLDTPGYQPADLMRTTLPGAAEPGTLAVTQPGHIAAVSDGERPGLEIVHDALPQGGDGNGVSLERELAKVEANRLRYQTTSELVSRRLALLRYAAGDGI